MAVTGNPYGFYPDRTKYPLANLDGQLVPAPHEHVLADISDYPSVDPQPVPSEQGAWEVINDDKTLSLKEAYAIPVEEEITYKFQLNEGYRGTILYKEDGGSEWVDVFKNQWPAQFPVYWECPDDGSVRFLIEKVDTTNISLSDLSQLGLIFVPFSISDLEKDFKKEMEQEYLIFKQAKSINGVSRDYYLFVFRRGHVCTFRLVGYTPDFPSASSGDRGVILKNADWVRCNASYETITGQPNGVPTRCMPSLQLGDLYVNSDQWLSKSLWLNISADTGGKVGGTNGGIDEYPTDKYTMQMCDMIIWGNSAEAKRNGQQCVATHTFPCLGATAE